MHIYQDKSFYSTKNLACSMLDNIILKLSKYFNGILLIMVLLYGNMNHELHPNLLLIIKKASLTFRDIANSTKKMQNRRFLSIFLLKDRT